MLIVSTYKDTLLTAAKYICISVVFAPAPEELLLEVKSKMRLNDFVETAHRQCYFGVHLNLVKLIL
jgi:hypothetical protein